MKYPLIMAIMFLALLTIIGLSASRTSTIEVQIANNAMEHTRTFYAAEAGLQHAIKLMEDPFVGHNADRVRSGTVATWSFALDGTYHPVANDPNGDGIPAYDPNHGGAVWVINQNIGGIDYTVSVWNNNDADPQTITSDNDGLIWVQSDAVSPRGARSSVRLLLQGNTTGEDVTGYTAQAGAGAGKNYNATDLNAIGTFDEQYVGGDATSP